MSIINDAIKKADNKTNNTVNTALPISQQEDIKKPAITIMAIFVIILILGWVSLYRHSSIPVTKLISATKNPESNIQLNGVAYDNNDGRWAVINNSILKEGDSISGNKLTSITKDSVKLKKDNGEEILLTLK
jgi:hypothetical protein